MRIYITLALPFALPSCLVVYDVDGLADGASEQGTAMPETSGDDPPESGGTVPVPSTATSGSSCTEAFGAITEFMLCEETDTSCRFYGKLNNVSCTAHCEAAGWSCRGAEHNADEGCTAKSAEDCDAADNSDAICICGR